MHDRTDHLRVLQLGIESKEASLDLLIERIKNCPDSLPFSQTRIDFLASFSKKLSRRARRDGGAQALSYWLRRTELERMREEFSKLNRIDAKLFPRGLTFHIPPANVDTIFVYSLALAMLTGNRSIVRISSRILVEESVVLQTFLETLCEWPAVEQSTALISYGHDDEITQRLSRACDLRVIWGGDASVETIQRAPKSVFARDIVFPDRVSLAAINVDAYEKLNNAERDRLASRFFNDVFWFDQLGCSSPRIIAWVGGNEIARVSEEFHSRLNSEVKTRNYRLAPADVMAKLNYTFRSIVSQDAIKYRRFGYADSVLSVDDFPQFEADFCGAGFFFELRLPDLLALAPVVSRQHQTLSAFGFELSEIDALLVLLNGKGIDRVVPIGNALDFNRFWDGYDLLAEFTRRVAVTSPT